MGKTTTHLQTENAYRKEQMHKIQRPQNEYYTSTTSFRYAVGCNEIEGFIYQVPMRFFNLTELTKEDINAET